MFNRALGTDAPGSRVAAAWTSSTRSHCSVSAEGEAMMEVSMVSEARLENASSPAEGVHSLHVISRSSKTSVAME